MDSVTILAPESGLATKRVLSEGVTRAEPCVWHAGCEVQIKNAEALFGLLSRLVSLPSVYVVRGAIKDGTNMDKMRRTHVGAEATLVPQARRWIALDLDSVLPDVTDFAARPRYYAEVVRAMLPACFADAACFWQATGSAGFKPGVRLRLVFWLSRPVSDKEAKQWTHGWGVSVDRSLYTPSQPHYTASPVFVEVPDPVDERYGTLPGNAEVVVPVSLLTGEPYEALERAANAIARRPEGQRRTALNATAFKLARRYPEDALPSDVIFDVLDAAASASGLPGSEAQLTLRYAIRDGRTAHATEHAGWRDQISRDDKDNPRNTLANVALILTEHEDFKERFAHKSRDWSVVWVRSPVWGHKDRGSTVDQTDVVYIVQWFQTTQGMDVREHWVKSALHRSATGEYDPIVDWLEGLPEWDGEHRADTVFIRHLGVEDTKLNREITAVWLGQAVRRAYATVQEPVKADYLLLLIGPQGVGKSTVLERLCPPGAFRAGLPDLDSKDARVALSGSWIVELAEFTQRAADANSFKAFTTTLVDQYRPPYAATEVQVPRRCVLAVTTNDADPLVDRTGNRRFLPLVCTRHADFDALSEERDQVWAEIVARVRAGMSAVLPGELQADVALAQADRLEENPLAAIFGSSRVRFAPGCEWEPGQVQGEALRYLRTHQACAIAGVRADNTRAVSQVKDALRCAGWTESRDKERRRLWVPPNVPAEVVAWN